MTQPKKDYKTMDTTTIEKTVGELVSERPGRSRVFEEYGIDYCCGGKIPLGEACTKEGVDAEKVLSELARVDAATPSDDDVDYATMALDELVDHIISTHHAYLKEELPRMQAMSERVATVHGGEDERLGVLAGVVQALVNELSMHMMKEEQVLFPIICQLAQSNSTSDTRIGSIENPINAMEADHDTAGNALESMRRLTEGFAPPTWACNTYRALLDGLHELEVDLHLHIHKENNILFPRALELEKSRQ